MKTFLDVNKTNRTATRKITRALATFTLAVAPIFGSFFACDTIKENVGISERNNIEKEKDLLAQLANIKTISFSQKQALFDALKKFGGEATVKTLIPLLDKNRTEDLDMSYIIETLSVVARTHINMLIDAIENSTDSSQEGNAARVIAGMDIEKHKKLETLLGLYSRPKAERALFVAKIEIQKLLSRPINNQDVALIKSAYKKATDYGKYELLDIIGDYQHPEFARLIASALGDKESGTRIKAINRLKNQDIDSTILSAIKARVKEEDDPDTLVAILVLLRDKGVISGEACDYSAVRQVQRDSKGKLKVGKSQALTCNIKLDGVLVNVNLERR